MGQFPGGEQGVHLNEDEACTQNRRNRDGVLRQVRQHDGDTGACLQTKALEVGCQGL